MMNKIYKVIYSKVRNCYVVVSELAKNHSRGTKAEHTARKGTALTAALLLALSCVSVLGAPGAEAKTKTYGGDFIGVQHDSDEEASTSQNYQGGAVDQETGAMGTHAITIGVNTTAGAYTINIGDRLAPNTTHSIFIGSKYDANNTVHQDTGNEVVSLGYNSDAAGTGSIAIGYGAGADTFDNAGSGTNPDKSSQSIAIGYNATAKQNNIAIGANSVATAAASTATAKFRDDTDSDYKAPSSYVSVGSSTLKRRITNVAAGADENDAATVGQLEKAKGKYYSAHDGIQLGNYKTNEDNDGASALAGLAAGYETGTTGIASTVVGSYSGVIGSGLQGAASISLGTANINKADSGTYSGVANSIIGQGNMTTNSNAAIILGAGNTITDSYRDVTIDTSKMKTDTPEELETALQEAVAGSGAQVMAIGGGNKITSAYKTQVVGVGNTVSGTELNYVEGFNNNVTGGTSNYIIGAKNTLENGNNNIVFGDNHTLTNKKNNVVIGSADKKDNKNKELTASDAVVIGHNADVTVDGGIAIGSGSVATADTNAEGYDPTSTADNKASSMNSITWKATTGAVSIGTNGTTTRRITNLAAGFNDTDAVNVAQIKKLANIDASNIGFNSSDDDDAVLANASAWGKALGLGKIASPLSKKQGYDQLITGGTMWYELKDGLWQENSFVSPNKTTAVNLRNLDNNTVQYVIEDGVSDSVGLVNSQYTEVRLHGYAPLQINYGTAITNLRSALQDIEDNPLKDENGNEITLTTATGDVLRHAVNLGDLQNAYNSLDTKVSGAHTAFTVEGSKAAATEAGKYNGKNIQLHSDTDATTGKVTYDVKLANDLSGITSISGSTDTNGAKITLDTTDKNISINGGSIKEVATNLDKDGNIIQGNENNAANMSDVKKMVENAKSEAEGNDVDTHVKADSYGVDTNHQVSMDIVDKNGKATGDKVTITDVAKSTEVGNVSKLDTGVKNADGKTTTVVDAINNVNTKVDKVDGKIGDQKYSKSNPSGSNKYVKDGDSITSAIGKLDGAVQQATSAAGKHSTVSAGSNITVHGETKSDGHTDYNVALNKDITVDSVTAKTTTTDNLTVNNSATIGGVTLANKTISGLDDTKIEKGSTKAVNANTIYNELRPSADGTYIKITNTTAQNITNLDTQVKKNSDLVNSDGTTIKIGGKDSATKVDVSDKNGKGRVITGVVTDNNDASSAANVGYVNNMAAANTQQIYRDMNNAYGRLDNNINRAAAGSNALAALHPLEFDPDDKLSFAMGYGHYHNANAAAVGAFYQPDSKTQFNFGVALGNGDPGFNAGIAFKLGKPSPYAGMNRVTLIHTVQDLKASDEAKDKRIDALEKENQEMKKQLQAIMAKLNG